MFNLPNRRGPRLSKEEIEQISRELATHLTASAPLQVIRHGTGLHLRLDYEFAFPAKIISGTQPYAWQEVYPTTNGTWQVPAVARTGTTAVNPGWERNNNNAVPVGTIVLMVRGFFNYNAAGQEYVFEFSASTSGGGPPPPSGTKAIPLQITSQGTVGGLYPAVILNYNAGTNTFSPSATNIWAITTQENPLQAGTNYTGIFLVNGGNPARDIYCINDNFSVGDSAGLLSIPGVNSLLVDPSYTWRIARGILPGQAIIERLLRVQDSQGSPPVDHTRIIQFFPYYTWNVVQDPIAGQADVRRLFEVWNAFVKVQSDVYQEIFTPACTWDINANGLGSVTIRRLLSVAGVPDIAVINVAPSYCWSSVSSACAVTLQRILIVQNVAGDRSTADVYNMTFGPDCTWLLTSPGAGQVQISRLFVVQDNTGKPPVNDVAKLTFTPDYTWYINAGSACEATVQRRLYVNAFGPDIYQITFSGIDFIVTNPSAGTVNINTNGLTTNVNYCGDDGTVHQLQFKDGLLQVVV